MHQGSRERYAHRILISPKRLGAKGDSSPQAGLRAVGECWGKMDRRAPKAPGNGFIARRGGDQIQGLIDSLAGHSSDTAPIKSRTSGMSLALK